MWLVSITNFFGEMFVGTRIGQILMVAVIGFFLGAKHEHNVMAGANEAAVVKAEYEANRRDYAIRVASKQALDNIKQIDELEARLSAVQKEINHASRANDHRPCLDVDSVRRLQRIR